MKTSFSIPISNSKGMIFFPADSCLFARIPTLLVTQLQDMRQLNKSTTKAISRNRIALTHYSKITLSWVFDNFQVTAEDIFIQDELVNKAGVNKIIRTFHMTPERIFRMEILCKSWSDFSTATTKIRLSQRSIPCGFKNI